jgi:Alpha-2-macroglobulin family/A-macroglobulin TED domain/A-macroglobulin receptor binding domain
MPAERLESADGALTVTVHDGGLVESISKSLPVLLAKLDVRFYPEGGALVAGAPTQLYVEAFLPSGEPADLDADLIELHGDEIEEVKVVASSSSASPDAAVVDADVLRERFWSREPKASLASVTTVHEGRGKCAFTPAAGAHYALKVYRPRGFYAPLPVGHPVLVSGAAASITLGDAVFGADESVTCSVHSRFEDGRPLKLQLAKEERVIVEQRIAAPPPDVALDVHLTVPDAARARGDASGTLRVTLLDAAADAPLAERLVFRRAADSIDVRVLCSREQVAPRDRIGIRVQTLSSSSGLPTPAFVALTVVDDASLEMVETRKHGPPLRAQAQLEAALSKPLRDAVKCIESAQHIDLLLGTQGWRRFVWSNSLTHAHSLNPPLAALASLALPTLHLSSGRRRRRAPRYDSAAYGSDSDSDSPRGGSLDLSSDDDDDDLNDIFEKEEEAEGRSRDARLSKRRGGAGKKKSFLKGGAQKQQQQRQQREGSMRAKSGGRGRGRAPGGGGGRGGGPAPPPMRPMASKSSAPPPPPAPSFGSAALSANAGAPPLSLIAAPGAPVLFGSVQQQPSAAPKMKKKKRGSCRRSSVSSSSSSAFSASSTLVGAVSYLSRANTGYYSFEREYAHQVPTRALMRADADDGDDAERDDFTSTIYWASARRTSRNRGVLSARFDVPDSVTTYRVLVDAHDAHGRLGGSSNTTFRCVKAFSIDAAKLPSVMSTGDTLSIPAVLANRCWHALDSVDMAVDVGAGLELLAPDGSGQWSQSFASTLAVAADSRERVMVLARATPTPRSRASINLSAAGRSDAAGGGELRDSVARHVKVKGIGFPQRFVASGTVGGRYKDVGNASHVDFDVAADRIEEAGTKTLVQLSWSSGSTLLFAVRNLMKEPTGCAEQVLATSWPLAMALAYFSSPSSPGIDVGTLTDCKMLLKRGYERLTKYECSGGGGGFEWYGAQPPHAALSAFAVLVLMDVRLSWDGVDEKLFARTVRYLEAQRDGHGRFAPPTAGRYAFSRPERDVSEAYVLFVLSEHAVSTGKCAATLYAAEIDSQWQALFAGARGHSLSDSYVLALLALTLNNARRADDARGVLDALAERMITATGELNQLSDSIVRSGGRSLMVEGAALAALGWMRVDAGHFDVPLRAAMQLIEASVRMVNTQAAALALKAITVRSYMEHAKKQRAAGSGGGGDDDDKRPAVAMLLDGVELATVPVGGASATGQAHVRLPSFARHLRSGQSHRLTLEARNVRASTVRFSASIAYKLRTPPSHADPPVALTLESGDAELVEGAGSSVGVTVTNRRDVPLGMAMCHVGLPGGVGPRREQLKGLVSAGRIAHFEVDGRQVIIYLRGMDASSSQQFPVDFVATVPGHFVAPPSRAYLYYNSTRTHWVEPLQVIIVASDNRE